MEKSTYYEQAIERLASAAGSNPSLNEDLKLMKDLVYRFMTLRYPELLDDGFHCPYCDMRLETRVFDSIRCHYCGTMLRDIDFTGKGEY